MRTCRRIAAICSTVLVTASPVAISNAAAQIVAPVPVYQSPPSAPTTRFGAPQEGWFIVRYSVLADGSTDNVAVIDKMPPQLIDREAITAVEGWVFRPATAEGEPVEWHNNEAVIAFDADADQLGLAPEFVRAYREVQDLIGQAEFGKALRRNENMQETVASSLMQIGLAQVQNASIQLQLGNAQAAYIAVVRATDPRIPTVQGDDLNVALQYRNALEMQLGDLVGARETLARRNAIATVPSDDLVAANISAIEQALSDGGTIVHQVRILDKAWRHSLDRRTFAISVAAGRVDAIRVECNRRMIELEYAADAEWTLPDAWGECEVAVEGREDTKLQFYEFQ